MSVNTKLPKPYQNNPIRRTAYLTGISVSTVGKVRKLNKEDEERKKRKYKDSKQQLSRPPQVAR